MSKLFSDLGINKALQQSLADLQISVPTDIQEKTIPVVFIKKKIWLLWQKQELGKQLLLGCLYYS